MALFATLDEARVDGNEPVEVETRATLTLPGGWCCGFARWVLEQSDGRREIETVFATRGGLRMTFSREQRPGTGRATIADGIERTNPRRRIGSRLDILV